MADLVTTVILPALIGLVLIARCREIGLAGAKEQDETWSKYGWRIADKWGIRSFQFAVFAVGIFCIVFAAVALSRVVFR